MNTPQSKPDNKSLPGTDWLARLIFVTAIIFPVAVMSAPVVTVRIKVVELPCILNNGSGEGIEVDFKDIPPKEVNGRDHLQTIGYTLVCAGNPFIQLRLRGEAVGFDVSALRTSTTDLGIALRANGRPLKVREWVGFVYPDKPVLQVVPVRRAGTDLKTGEFTASAVLEVFQQ